MLSLLNVFILPAMLTSPLYPPPPTPPPPPKIHWSVTPAAVVRTSAQIFDPDSKPYVQWLNPQAGLRVLLRFNGPLRIHAFMHLHIRHAGINTGLNLRLLAPRPDRIIRPSHTRLGQIARSAAVAGRILILRFALPPAKARSLTRLAGTVELVVGGHSRLVAVPHLSALNNGPVALPHLPHIHLRILSGVGAKPSRLLVLQIRSLPLAFRSAMIEDGTTRLSTGSICIEPSPEMEKIMLFLKHPLNSQSKLVLHLRTGQKIIRVKFSLHPMPLPS